MEEALKSQRKQNATETKKIKKYPTEISLMKSDISMASTMFN